jgi:uncharacterized membrane protein
MVIEMKSKTFTSNILPLLGLILVLALAFCCDTWMQTLKTKNASTFTLTSIIYLSYSITTLLVAGGLLSLFWILITKFPRNIGIGLIYLLAGIFMVLAFSLYFLVPFHGWLPNFIPEILKPNSYLFISGGFIGMIGLMLILLPKTDKA